MQRILANIFRIRFARIISRYLADTSRYIFASLRPGSTAPFEEISQRERAVGNTLSDLTGPRFEPHTSHSRDERVTARPTDRIIIFEMFYYNKIKPNKVLQFHNFGLVKKVHNFGSSQRSSIFLIQMCQLWLIYFFEIHTKNPIAEVYLPDSRQWCTRAAVFLFVSQKLWTI